MGFYLYGDTIVMPVVGGTRTITIGVEGKDNIVWNNFSSKEDWIDGKYNGYIGKEYGADLHSFDITVLPMSDNGSRVGYASFAYDLGNGKSGYVFIAIQQTDESYGISLLDEEPKPMEYVEFNYNPFYFKADGRAETNGGVVEVTWVGDLRYRTASPSNEWVSVGAYTEVESTSTNKVIYRYPIGVNRNLTDKVRYGTVEFYAESTGAGVVSGYLSIVQAGKSPYDDNIVANGEIYYGAIWQDVEYDFGAFDQIDYSLYQGDKLIFSGRSCKTPDTTTNKILVNKLCQSYLNSPKLHTDYRVDENGFGTFYLKSYDGGTIYATFNFVNDWSYDNNLVAGLLSHPILNDHSVVRGQLAPFSLYGDNLDKVIGYGVTFMDGVKDEYNNPLTDIRKYVTAKNGVKTILFPELSQADVAKSYSIGSTTYPIIDDCSVKYVLYYVNPWGGFDWFPIKGRVKEIDNIKQYTYIGNYNNNSWGFGKRSYINEITKKYTVSTHWLKDDESSRMWYLLQSNTVYLHNLQDGKIESVIITTTQQEHKKRTQGSSRISYQFDLEVSQTRERM